MNEQPKGHCKHGEFDLREGCPKCIEERSIAVEGVTLEDGDKITVEATITLPAGDTKGLDIVKVRYYSETRGELSQREYSYFSVEPLDVGDIVIVPVRDTTRKAKVTAINIPESEIAAFRDQVKTIPSGAKIIKMIELDTVQEEEATPAKEDWRVIRPLLDKPFIDQGGEIVIPKGIAMVKVNPEVDQRAIDLYREGVRLHDFAQARIISTNEDLKPAANDLAIIAKTKNALKEVRKEYIVPIRSHLDQVNSAFKTLLAPFEEADRITREKVTEFGNEQRRRAAEAQRIEDEKLRLAKEEAALSGTGEITVPLGTAPTPPAVPKNVRTDLGTLGGRIYWKAEVVDFALLSDEYKLPNMSLLSSFAKSTKGTKEILGVRIYSETGVTVRTK